MCIYILYSFYLQLHYETIYKCVYFYVRHLTIDKKIAIATLDKEVVVFV